jgi:hypothetical protein
MDDALGVRFGDAFDRLQHVRHRDLRLELAFARQHRREVLALQQLHHDVRRAIVEATDVEDPAHVLAAQLRDGAGLAQEAIEQVRRRPELAEHELQGDRLIELEVRGRDDHAHPTDSEDALDAVLAREDVPRVRLKHHES